LTPLYFCDNLALIMKRKTAIGIIGCGNMGEAILAQCKKARIFDFIAFEKDTARANFIHKKYRIPVAKDISNLVLKSDIVLIAVKPQDIESVLDEINTAQVQWKKQGVLIISIAAGIMTRFIEDKLGNGTKVVRAMPNLPAVIGKGITALVKGQFAKDKDLKTAKKIFASVGETLCVANEEWIDAVTAISGSGPAYIFYIVGAFARAGVKLGLDEKSANYLIRHTILGAMDLLKVHVYDTNALIAKVKSKGGTTEAALKVFDEENLLQIIENGIKAARDRARDLSR
jgi:pyrroline-5-carboxylate reductase